MIRFFLVICGVIWSTSTFAQSSVTVRTGEHGAFTRVVVQMPQNATWRLTQSEAQAQLVIDGVDVTFNLSRVFDRINRNRIRSIVQEQPGMPLVLSLGCKCVVEATQGQNRLVILDVREGKAPNLASDRLLPTLSGQAYRFSFLGQTGATRLDPLAASPTKNDETQSKPAVAMDADLPLLPTQQAANPVLMPKVRDLSQMALFERLVASRLERASRQGLVARRKDATPIDRHDENVTAESEISAANVDQKPAPETTERLGISVTTAIDRDLQAISKAAANLPKPVTRQCPNTLEFFRNAAQEQTEFTTAIAGLRADLVTELDDVRDDVLWQLAQRYLTYGFGAESRQALALMSGFRPDTDLLQSIALIVDGSHLEENPFSELSHCSDGFAFWGYAAERDSGDFDVEAVLRGFLALPLELRENLGPKITEALLDIGNSEAAASVARATRRVQENYNPELLMAEAALALDAGAEKEGKEVLAEVVDTASDQSPLALIDLVNQKLTTREGVAPSDVSLIEAYIQEYRDTDLVAPLQRAHVLGLALNGSVEDAVKSLFNSDSLTTSESMEQTRLDVFSLALENGSDFDFARYGMYLLETPPGTLTRELARRSAERFLSMGLASSAQRALLAAPASTADQTERILEARIHLEMRLPHQAMIALLGIDSTEAEYLRAEAMSLKADFEAAAPVYKNSGATKDAALAYYLAGDLDEVKEASLDDGSLYARLAQAEQEIDALSLEQQSDGSLDGARNLLDQSQDIRAQIDTLLEPENLVEN